MIDESLFEKKGIIMKMGVCVMRKKITATLLFLLIANMAAAVVTTVWNPAANPSGTGLWTEGANWTGGTAPMTQDGDWKAVFNVSNARECILGTTVSVAQLVMGDNGTLTGNFLRLVDGAYLTSGLHADGTTNWTAIGYNRSATMVVEAGAVFETKNYLLIGRDGGDTGESYPSYLIIDGGTAIINGTCFLGNADATKTDGGGHVTIDGGGLLSAASLSITDTAIGRSFLDILDGTVVINGDQSVTLGTMVADGRVRAFGGTGKVIYDYDVTNPGKTTVTAVEPVEGDLDEDFDVDMMDLQILADNWLYPNCGGPVQLDDWCKVDFRDFAVLSSNWMRGKVTHWHIAQTQYPTDDLIVTPHYAENYGIVGDGVTDVTDAIQEALISVSNLGGGALFLPAGQYKISGTLSIPARVILRGDWQKPSPDGPVAGTVLMAYAGRGDENGTPFIGLSNSAGVKGLTIWYPEQMPDNIQPYPPSLQLTGGGNQGVEDVTFVNAYIGFTNFKAGSITASPFVRQIYGTPLKLGIEFDNLADVGRLETVHFSPAYWKNSGLPNSPIGNQHAQWIYNNGIGVRFGRIDWSYSSYVTVEGYNVGLMLWPTREPDSTSRPNGQSYGFTLRNCQTGVHIIETSYAGYMFTRFTIDQVETGIYLAPSTKADATLFHTCTINASNYAVFNEGQKRVLMASCDFQNGQMRFDDGYLSVTNSDFGSASGSHIVLNSGSRGATIMGNRFTRTAQIVDNTSNYVYINHTAIPMAPLPAYDYKMPEQPFTAAKAALYVVTYPPYNAAADGVTDDTAAFQSALADAKANGGGIVFVPGGTYRLDGTLVVAAGVELRGIFDIPHGTSARGSLLETHAGKNDANGTPFIQIEPGAGLRGLTIHYPGQIYDAGDTVNYGMTPYPFMIRGLGADVYVINVSSTIPYQLLDLATYRCDRHYVDHMISTALLTGIHVGNGSQDGQIQNCQFNPSAYTHQANYYDSIPYNTSDGIHSILWRQSQPYLFGDVSGQVIHQNFVFGGLYGIHLVEENGNSPTGYCLGMGIDQCTNAMQIDSIGSEGLDMINSQIVTVNCENGRYLEVGDSFDDIFRMFCSAGWGCHAVSAGINGGDVELQLFHLARDAESTVFDVRNDAHLRDIGGNLTDYLDGARPYVSIDATATAEFLGNIIRTPSSNMPPNTSNVTSLGNVRVP